MEKLWKRKISDEKNGKKLEIWWILKFNIFFHNSFPHGKPENSRKSRKNWGKMKSYPQKWHKWFQHEKTHVIQGVFKICPHMENDISHSFQHSFQQMWKTRWKVWKDVFKKVHSPANTRNSFAEIFRRYPDGMVCIIAQANWEIVFTVPKFPSWARRSRSWDPCQDNFLL